MGGRPLKRSLQDSVVRPLVFGLDAHLRRANGVFEFSEAPGCILRAAKVGAPWSFGLSDGAVVRAGDPAIELHLWNERLPRMEQGAPTIAWASRMSRGFIRSFKLLARHLDAHAEFDDVAAIFSILPLVPRERTDQLLRVCGAVGLERIADGPRPRPLGRARRVGENILGLLLTLAANPASASVGVLARVRTPVAMSRATLRRRHGDRSGGENRRSSSSIAPDVGLV
jgi:hypothetical protein